MMNIGILSSGRSASFVPATSPMRQYLLRVVSNGHYITKLASGRDRHGLLMVSYEAQPVPPERAPSFEGGPHLDWVIAECGKSDMHIFPVKVDR